jgi:hypothetical protein
MLTSALDPWIEHLDGLPSDAPGWPWRHAALLADFWKLRKLIG